MREIIENCVEYRYVSNEASKVLQRLLERRSVTTKDALLNRGHRKNDLDVAEGAEIEEEAR